MTKQEIIKWIIILVISIVSCGIAVTGWCNAQESNELHVIALSQDDKAEVEIIIDDKIHDTVFLDKGINYLPYKAKVENPTVKVSTYGDTVKLKPKEGKNGEWYTFIRIEPPRDGDGKDVKDRVL